MQRYNRAHTFENTKKNDRPLPPSTQASRLAYTACPRMAIALAGQGGGGCRGCRFVLIFLKTAQNASVYRLSYFSELEKSVKIGCFWVENTLFCGRKV
jgi:hypothetical protein